MRIEEQTGAIQKLLLLELIINYDERSQIAIVIRTTCLTLFSQTGTCGGKSSNRFCVLDAPSTKWTGLKVDSMLLRKNGEV